MSGVDSWRSALPTRLEEVCRALGVDVSDVLRTNLRNEYLRRLDDEVINGRLTVNAIVDALQECGNASAAGVSSKERTGCDLIGNDIMSSASESVIAKDAGHVVEEMDKDPARGSAELDLNERALLEELLKERAARESATDDRDVSVTLTHELSELWNGALKESSSAFALQFDGRKGTLAQWYDDLIWWKDVYKKTDEAAFKRVTTKCLTGRAADAFRLARRSVRSFQALSEWLFKNFGGDDMIAEKWKEMEEFEQASRESVARSLNRFELCEFSLLAEIDLGIMFGAEPTDVLYTPPSEADKVRWFLKSLRKAVLQELFRFCGRRPRNWKEVVAAVAEVDTLLSPAAGIDPGLDSALSVQKRGQRDSVRHVNDIGKKNENYDREDTVPDWVKCWHCGGPHFKAKCERFISWKKKKFGDAYKSNFDKPKMTAVGQGSTEPDGEQVRRLEERLAAYVAFYGDIEKNEEDIGAEAVRMLSCKESAMCVRALSVEQRDANLERWQREGGHVEWSEVRSSQPETRLVRLRCKLSGGGWINMLKDDGASCCLGDLDAAKREGLKLIGIEGGRQIEAFDKPVTCNWGCVLDLAVEFRSKRCTGRVFFLLLPNMPTTCQWILGADGQDALGIWAGQSSPEIVAAISFSRSAELPVTELGINDSWFSGDRLSHEIDTTTAKDVKGRPASEGDVLSFAGAKQLPNMKVKINEEVFVNVGGWAIDDPEVLGNLTNLLKEHEGVFITRAVPLGHFKGGKFSVGLPDRERAVPVQHSIRKMKEEDVLWLDEKFEEYVKEGVYKEMPQSRWWSRAFVARNRKGKRRAVGDYVDLNSKTDRVEFKDPPTVAQLRLAVRKASVFSTVDVKGCWTCFEVEDADQEVMTLALPNGRKFAPRRCNFGPKNAVAFCATQVRGVLAAEIADGLVFVFFDDVFIMADNMQSHLTALRRVLKKLKDSGLLLEAEKTRFCAHFVKFVGNIYGADSFAIDEEFRATVLAARRPRTMSELRSFIGTVSYTRDFVPNMADMLFPLNALLRTKRLKWTLLAQKAFDYVKEKVAAAEPLHLATGEGQIVLQCDASSYAIGVSCFERRNDDKMYLIGLRSRQLSDSQRRWSNEERETLSVVVDVELFRPLCVPRVFVVQGDHSNIARLWEKGHEGRLARWAVRLQDVSFVMESIKGVDNKPADMLSRLIDYEKMSETVMVIHQPRRSVRNVIRASALEVAAGDVFDEKELMGNEMEGLQAATTGVGDLSGIGKAQLEDSQCTAIARALRGEEYVWASISALWRKRVRGGELMISEDGVLMTKEKRVVVPRSNGWPVRVITAFHNEIVGHLGAQKTIEELELSYVWYGLRGDVRALVGGCVTCAEIKGACVVKPTAMRQFPVLAPNDALHVDFIEKLPRTPSVTVSHRRYSYNFQKVFTICKTCSQRIPQYTTCCSALLFSPPVYPISGLAVANARIAAHAFLNDDVYHVLLSYMQCTHYDQWIWQITPDRCMYICGECHSLIRESVIHIPRHSDTRGYLPLPFYDFSIDWS